MHGYTYTILEQQMWGADQDHNETQTEPNMITMNQTGARQMRRRKTALSAVVASIILVAGCARTVQVTAGSLTFQASTAWECQTPEHESRHLQFSLPSPEEGVENAELVVWSFPGMRDAGDGRMIKLHMDRWVDQFAQGDSLPPRNAAVRRQYVVNGLPVHCTAVTGRYIAESAPGSGITVERPNHRMIAAYIVAPHGDYIVKMSGPQSVVDHHSPAFDRFIKSVRTRQPAWPLDQPTNPSQPRAQLTATKQTP